MRASALKTVHAKCTIGVAIGMCQSGPCQDSEVAEPGFETLKGNEMIAQANKFLHLPLLAGGIAAIVVSGIALASLAIAPRSLSESAASAEPVQVATAPASAAAGSRGHRCAVCGVIESTRKLETPGDRASIHAAPVRPAAGHRAASKDQPAQDYETTIRLHDGSMRVITDANPARWRPGERVTVIAGLQ
jgi:hypothetical protein